MWLQDFVWAEADKADRLAQRADYAVGSHERQLLSESPMFCLETALCAHRAPLLPCLPSARSLAWMLCASYAAGLRL